MRRFIALDEHRLKLLREHRVKRQDGFGRVALDGGEPHFVASRES